MAGPLVLRRATVLWAVSVLASGCTASVASGSRQEGRQSPAASYTSVAMDPAVAGAVELIYRRMDVEVVFCLEAEFDPETNAHRVIRAYIAPQAENTLDGAVFSCEGAAGYLHNHSRREPDLCQLSVTDHATLEEGGYAFAVGWCPTRRFFWALAPAETEAVLAAPRPP